MTLRGSGKPRRVAWEKQLNVSGLKPDMPHVEPTASLDNPDRHEPPLLVGLCEAYLSAICHQADRGSKQWSAGRIRHCASEGCGGRSDGRTTLRVQTRCEHRDEQKTSEKQHDRIVAVGSLEVKR